MDKILVATDGSDDSERAVDFAARLTNESGARLLIVNVMGIHSLPDALFSQFTPAQNSWIREHLASESSRILKDAAARARERGIAAIQLESRDGEVASTILAVAEDTAADAIVVGKRGSGRVSGLLLGSVSQKLVSLASVPVIVVP